MFATNDELNEKEVERGLRAITQDGVASQAMGTLAGGVFLVALALKLGASNFVIGLLAAIPFLANLIQIPAIYLVEKYRLRRAICVVSSGASRTFLLFIAITPLLVSTKTALFLVILWVLLHAAFAALSACSWNSWMRDVVPQSRLGSFFSTRLTLMSAVGILLSLAAGFFIDWWSGRFVDLEIHGYSILFGLGCGAGMLGVYFISTIPEPRMRFSESRIQLSKLISEPFKDANFKNLIVFLAAWNFAVNLAAPFFTVYLLQRLGLSMTWVIGLQVLSQTMNLISFRAWGKMSDRYSNKSVLAVCGPLFMFSILAFTFTTLPEKHLLTLPLIILIHMAMGIFTAGVTLASGNIGLKLAPKGQATAYLAANSLVNSIAAGLAPIIGGACADFFSQRELALTLSWKGPEGMFSLPTLNLQQWDFFFVLAFLLGLYSIHRLSAVKEVGEVEEEIVIQELVSEARRVMRGVSTVAGLRYMIQFPFALLSKAQQEAKTIEANLAES